MPFQVRKDFATVLEMEVADPTPYGGVDLGYYFLKRFHRHLTFCENGDTILDCLQGSLRWLDMRIQIPRLAAFPHPDGETKKIKLSLVRIDNLRLCSV